MSTLSNLPLKTKYAYLDQVYIWKNDLINSAIIDSWRVEVDNPNNDEVGRQIVYYKFAGLEDFELDEDVVFASKNHILFHIKNDDLNRSFESGGGAHSYFTTIDPTLNGRQRSFGSWTDLAGWNFSGMDLINDLGNVDILASECIFDATILWGAILPPGLDTKEEFKAAVKSYDRKSTLWVDSFPIGI